MIPKMYERPIDGGIVGLAFSVGDKRLKAGSKLTRDEISGMANSRNLIRTGHIVPFLADDVSKGEPPTRHVIRQKDGRHIVVSGHIITPEPVTKEQAEALVAEGN